jgi:mannose-6-phosphate isomerase-like protein (cupin superfamily)
MSEGRMLGKIETAPDGSSVSVLIRTQRASVIHCSLPPGAVSRAVRHKCVEEIWYCLHGRGRAWCADATIAKITDLEPGVCLSIAPGTRFQFRNDGSEQLEIIITTIPPWPGNDEAVLVEGAWAPVF